jgi:hypothetical protein
MIVQQIVRRVMLQNVLLANQVHICKEELVDLLVLVVLIQVILQNNANPAIQIVYLAQEELVLIA